MCGRPWDTHLWLIALDTLHLLECLIQGIGALLQSVEDAIVFLLVQLIAWLALLWWVDHHLHDTLTQHGWAQLDRDELVDFLRNLWVEADKLKVTTSVTALANHALGHRVQRSELEVVVLAWRFLLQVAKSLLERDELANEDVGLVNFVCDYDETLLGGKLEHGLDVFSGQ